MLRHATRVAAYAGLTGSTAWVFDVPGGRFTLALSPDPFRGFSGEGTLLMLLSDSEAESHGRMLLDQLGWASTVDAEDLARLTGLPGSQVASGLAWLSASGRLGFDLSDGAWFHRELPIESEKVLRRNPRLKSAQDLVEAGAVTATGQVRWTVRGVHDTYELTAAVRRGLVCSCPWELEHAGTRGPCKHVLAVVITVRG